MALHMRLSELGELHPSHSLENNCSKTIFPCKIFSRHIEATEYTHEHGKLKQIGMAGLVTYMEHGEKLSRYLNLKFKLFVLHSELDGS